MQKNFVLSKGVHFQERAVKSTVLKFPSDQTINLRIINEKQGSSASEINSNVHISTCGNDSLLSFSSEPMKCDS